MIKAGIHLTLDAAAYFADPCPLPSVTQSLVKTMLDRSPRHAMIEHPRLYQIAPEPEEYSAVRAIGNAAHSLMIGRGKDLEVIQAENFRTKSAQEAREAATDAGKVAILEKHFDRAVLMVNAAREQLKHAGWADAFHIGYGEAVMLWDERGIWHRTMIDWLGPLACYDYKTTGASVAPHIIGRKACDDGWHIQAAMHERGLNVLDADNAGRRKFRFVAQENEPPFALVAVELDEHWLTMGRKMLDFGLRSWRECMETGIWPGYPLRPITPDYPAWSENVWLEREHADFERRQSANGRDDFSDLIMAG